MTDTFSLKAKDMMLLGLAASAKALALITADGGEPQNDRYAPIALDPQDWAVADGNMVYGQVEFGFSGPVGEITACQIIDGSGDVLITRTFDQPYDFTKYGGSLRVAVLVTIA